MLQRIFSFMANGRFRPSEYGSTLMAVGVVVVIVAQVVPSTPIAASFALIGWGGRLATRQRRRRPGFVPADVAMVAVYSLLTLLAFAAQLDLAWRSGSFAWRIAATIDAWAALLLATALIVRTFSELLQLRCEER